MPDKERIQLNLRLDGYRELKEAVEAAAARQNTSVNSFVIEALKMAVGMEDTPAPETPTLDTILEAVHPKLDSMLAEKLTKEDTLDNLLVTKLADEHMLNLLADMIFEKLKKELA